MNMMEREIEIVQRAHSATGRTTSTLATKGGERWFGTLDVKDIDDTNALADEMVRRWNAGCPLPDAGEPTTTVTEWAMDDLTTAMRRLTRFISGPIMVVDDKGAGAEGQHEHRMKFMIWTRTYEYTIRARERSGDHGYLGCQSSARTPLPGATETGGRDLRDGPLCAETWEEILADIVAHEILPVEAEGAYILFSYDTTEHALASHAGEE